MKSVANVLTFAFCLCVLAGCSHSLGDNLQKYGYTELRPPSTLVQPGSIVVMQGSNPVTVSIVCTQKASLGKDFEVLPSQTSDMTLVESVTKNFDIDANYLQTIQAQAGYSAVKKISLKLSNARIAAVSGDMVSESVPNRTPGCQGSIFSYMRANRKLTMIDSVLIADVTYDVTWDDKISLSASAKAELLNGLAPKLGISHASTGSEKITGTGLIWGIHDDTILAGMTNDRKLAVTVTRFSAPAYSMSQAASHSTSDIEKVDPGIDKRVLDTMSGQYKKTQLLQGVSKGVNVSQ